MVFKHLKGTLSVYFLLTSPLRVSSPTFLADRLKSMLQYGDWPDLLADGLFNSEVTEVNGVSSDVLFSSAGSPQG